MEFERLELPFEEAVIEAAKQNFERDNKFGLIRRFEWNKKSVRDEYEEEAKIILTETGENYYPDFLNHKHIVLKK